MPDTFDENGLQIKTFTEIQTDLGDGYKEIYGDDINIDQNSPDGQQIGIISQIATDLRELIAQINAGFDPDQAVGIVLDQRAAINNIQRQGGTFTIQPIDIVTTQTVDLVGLDDDFNDIDGTGYTIADNAGNEYILIDSVTLTAGTDTVNFRAKEIGQIEATAGTITNPVTIVLGVESVTNSSGALQIGADEETDAELRTRRQRSVAISSSGYLNGLQGDLLALDGVTEAIVYENVTNSVDADGIPAHGIWAIVEGGANSEIGNTIYNNKSYGANMKGDVEVSITTPADATFIAKFDRSSPEDLYLRFDIQPFSATSVFEQDAIKTEIVASAMYTIGQAAETSRLTAICLAAIQNTGGEGVPVNVEISKNGTDWFDYLTTTTKDLQFVLANARITITEL